MQLTQKLLGFLNVVFEKDSGAFLALRVRYNGAMTWSIQDGILTTAVTGGSGVGLMIDLSQYTIIGLAGYIISQPGYDVPYVNPDSNTNLLSALVLMDGGDDQAKSNGDHLNGYTSLLWAYLEANAAELQEAESQIPNALAQMSIPTAAGTWLDYICDDVYGIPRLNLTVGGIQVPETDLAYGPRALREILAPRSNNKAIELALIQATGGQTTARVVNANVAGPGFPIFDGSITYNGSHLWNSSASRVRNLFDVTYSFDLEGAQDISGFQQTIVDTIEKYRAAGTHLRQISLSGSQLFDTVSHASDSATLTKLTTNFFNGSYRYDGTIDHSGESSFPDAMS